MTGRVHVIGGGLSGLAAAVSLASGGRAVTVWEQAGQAGGRCRSFFDDGLQRTIDNGNHLVLSGNRSLQAYLRTIGALDRLSGPERAAFPFIDLASGERWTVRPGAGRVPWWVLSAARRIPQTRLREYLAAWRLARAGDGCTVADCVGGSGQLYRRFWEPLCVSALNTAAEEGAARLLWQVLRETFGRGEAACRPLIATAGLAESFVEPALDYLRARGAEVRLHSRLRAIETEGDRVSRLHFTGDAAEVDVSPHCAVILAVPPGVATSLLPGLEAPQGSRAIVNGHFLLPRSAPVPSFLGLIGGVSQWLFLRGDVASVTVSAADDLARESNDAIAALLWPEVCRALRITDPALPRWRIVKEKRATFAQTPAEVSRRPGCGTRWKNLRLAGDWTDTGLPATIEGSVRSGHTAAANVFACATRA